MNKKIIMSLSLLALISGCSSPKNPSPLLAKVNNYEITLAQFEEEFKDSWHRRNPDAGAKKEFLNQLIDRQVILQEAQRLGIDKEADFLKLVQRFWEQSLLKLMLEDKARQISGSVKISDAQVRAEFDKRVKNGTTDKPYEEAYKQLKWELTKEKESKLLGEWVDALRKKARVEENLNLLNK